MRKDTTFELISWAAMAIALIALAVALSDCAAETAPVVGVYCQETTTCYELMTEAENIGCEVELVLDVDDADVVASPSREWRPVLYEVCNETWTAPVGHE